MWVASQLWKCDDYRKYLKLITAGLKYKQCSWGEQIPFEHPASILCHIASSATCRDQYLAVSMLAQVRLYVVVVYA